MTRRFLHAATAVAAASAVPNSGFALAATGVALARALAPTSQFWRWRGTDVHYATHASPTASNACVVFCPGFGAGAFQFDDVCRSVAEGGVDAHAMDWVGQGRSWPEGDMAGSDFGVESWVAQLRAFVESDELQNYERVYVAGNSIGGLVSALATARGDGEGRLRGCCLLNPTPFWSFWGPGGSPLWNGTLPGPPLFEAFGATWFGALKDQNTVRRLLGQVYAIPERADAALAEEIVAAAAHPNGPRVFASILFSGRATDEFDDVARKLGELSALGKADVAFVYGRDDPPSDRRGRFAPPTPATRALLRASRAGGSFLRGASAPRGASRRARAARRRRTTSSRPPAIAYTTRPRARRPRLSWSSSADRGMFQTRSSRTTARRCPSTKRRILGRERCWSGPQRWRGDKPRHVFPGASSRRLDACQGSRAVCARLDAAGLLPRGARPPRSRRQPHHSQ